MHFSEVVAGLSLIQCVRILNGYRQIRYLSATMRDTPAPLEWPRVCVVIPARNEELKIERALQSILQQDYSNLEVLVVNDRSTDRTAEILENLQQENSKLKTVTITELPSGWLGKVHALSVGSQQTKADYILFTDADVVFEPQVLRQAIAVMEHEQIDHMAMMMGIHTPTFLLKCFVSFFGLAFFGLYEPWKAKNPRSSRFIGIGGFNLIRCSVLESTQAFERIRLRPDDDVKLGKVIKTSGHKQELMFAGDTITVEWYSHLRECIRGLEKNSFAGLEYRLWFAILSCFLIFCMNVLPVFWMIFGHHTNYWAGLIGYVSSVIAVWGGLRIMRQSWYGALLYPIGAVLMIYIVLRTTYLNLRQGGLQWRDTFYSLEDLRKNKV